MLIARSPARLSLLLVLASSPVAVVACAYDWAVGVAPLQAEGGASDATVPDATSDASLWDAALRPDSGGDAGAPPQDSSVSCYTLKEALDNARSAAKACIPSAGQCTTDLIDECECKSYVADAGSPAANAFVSALGAFKDAGCIGSCDAAPCLTVPGSCYLATGLCTP
jgi:hypothetical protein